MLLREIVDDVVDILARPDLINFVKLRAQQQLKLLHALDNWPRDKVEQLITIQNPSNTIRTNLPAFWRKFDVLAPCDAVGNIIILPSQSVDTIGYRETDPRMITGFRQTADMDYYYVAGDVVNIRSSTAPEKLYASYYKYPDLRSTEATTWITENFPELVTYRVLYACYAMLGNMEQRAVYEALYQEAKEVFILDSAYSGVA
ncbi:hypothetical protein P5_0017 [Aeromonas phage P5]|nr:hypothetical protein P5_0017 [Aeromonas phage P5]